MTANDLFDERFRAIRAQVSRTFVRLLLVQWAASFALAIWISPETWSGPMSSTHPHVFAAITVGGCITMFPAVLGWKRPDHPLTPHVLACAQACWSGLLIHLMGGRIEAHFHVFGSLAFVAFYRDWKVLIPCSLVVAMDHLVRGLYWPESVYGIANPAWWQTLEHGSWVVFIDAFLIQNCIVARRTLRAQVEREVALETSKQEVRELADSLETRVAERTAELLRAMSAIERFEAIVENTKDCMAILVRDAEAWRCIYLNAATSRVLGDARWVERIVATQDEILHGWSGERDLEAHDGNWVPVELELQLHVPADGVEFLSFGARDLRERNKLEAELLQAQKLESIGQLAAGIAHEINTPMQYIGDNTHFLKTAFDRLLMQIQATDAWIDEGARAQLEALRTKSKLDFLVKRIPRAIDSTLEGVAAVSSIVGAMKAFSHPGSDEKSRIDLNRALETTITVSRNEWKYVADIQTSFDPDLTDVPALPGELNQVFLNILVNAAHAIQAAARSEKGTICISTRREGDRATVRISDDGCGMPDSVRAKIFDPFFTTKEVGKGTGQGLAIARGIIVDKHGGIIEVETVDGEGTTFTIRLPCDDVPALAAE